MPTRSSGKEPRAPDAEMVQRWRAAAVATLSRKSSQALMAKAFRKWSLVLACVLHADMAITHNVTVQAAAANPENGCDRCTELVAQQRAVTLTLNRLHQRLAGRDRLITYYGSQRDAAVRTADSLAFVIGLRSALVPVPSQPITHGPPPPLPAQFADPAAASMSSRPQGDGDAAAATSERAPVPRELVLARHAAPRQLSATDAELRQRIAALEQRLRTLGHNPASVVWPALPSAEAAGSKAARVANIALASPRSARRRGDGPLTTAAAVGAPSQSQSHPSAGPAPVAPAFSAPPSARRRSLVAAVAASTNPLDGSVMDETVSVTAASSLRRGSNVSESGAVSPSVSAAAILARPLSSCDSIVDDSVDVGVLSVSPGRASTPPEPRSIASAHVQPAKLTPHHSHGPYSAQTKSLVGTRRNDVITATLSALDEDSPFGSASPAPRSSISLQHQQVVTVFSRNLRLQRPPAEAHVPLASPVYPRAFQPSHPIRSSSNGGPTAAAAGAKQPPQPARVGAASAGAGPAQAAASYRVVPQKQPAMGVGSKARR
jgi:hypothetical protein